MSSNYRFGDGLPSKSSRVGPIRRFKTANLLSGPYRGANLLNGTYRPSETAASAGSSLEGTLASIAELIGPIKSDGPYTAREMALADLIGPLLSAGPYTAREEAPRGQQAAQGPLSLADLIGPLQSDGPYTAEHMTPPDMASELIGPLQSSGPYSAYGPAGHQAEYAEISGYPFQPPQKLPPMEAIRETQQQMVQAQEPEPPPIGSITRKADGTTDLKGVSSKFLEDVMGQMSDLKTMKTAAMARVAQLRQQESSGSPLLDALSQFAGNMASNDPTMPGWVRALGQTNLQMGSQGIKRERMAEEQKAFAYGKELSDTSLAAMRFSELEEARREKREGTDLEERRVAVLEQNAKTSARNTALDNFRADMTPVLTSARQTGLFTPEHETAIRSLKERHPDMSDTDIEREINLAKGTAKAAFSEKERVQKARAAEATAKAGAALNRVAAANGMRVNTLVQTEQVKAGARQASAAKVDAKEAARIEGLHNLAADVEGLEKDNWWQGVISGKIAQGAPLTTEQQMLVATRARAFVSKMQTMGLSFAKTSEKEMEKILATVPQPGQTQGAMKQLMALMDRDARRAAAEIGAFNWGETTDSIAQMFPARYVDSAVEAHQRKLQSLTPQQRMGLGIINGDDDEIAAGLSRISGSTQQQNSTRPGEIRMATPGGKKRVSYEDYVK